MEAVINQQQMLWKTLEVKETNYNPQLRMLRTPFKSPGYHTTIKQAEFIHSTHHSLIYALGLLDTELAEYEPRAFDILEQVISLQSTDRGRSTFGLWPWFYEEPLEQMSPPDWNWADFCGKQLVLAILRHGARFPLPLRKGMQEAICNACDAIIIRDVGPGYTNIAIMGAFVTLIAGELFGREDYRSYGLERLKKLSAYTRRRGAFQEYNSPTYTYIAILELSKIVSSTRSDIAKGICEELLDMAWKSVSEQYHVGTGQWSGPHSRSYETLLVGQNKAFLQLATDGALMFFPWNELPYNEEWYLSGIKCPARHIPSFITSETREIRQCYETNEEGGEKWATSYLTPAFTLGSFSQEIMWNQRRALLAYIDNGGEPTYAHLRFLHDGYDYCSAVLHSSQEAGHVLFGVSFLTEGGDRHPNLDRMNGSIEAADFRLRLEIGGCLERVNAISQSDGVHLRVHETALRLRTWHAAFEGGMFPDGPLAWVVSEADGKLLIDLVLYNGERAKIDFYEISQAALAFSLMIGETEQSFVPDIEATEDHIAIRGNWNECALSLEIPSRPVRNMQ